MKQNRFTRMMNNQTASAKRVYEAVPIQEDWSSSQINRELYRLGTKLDFNIIEGCLNTLKEAKLIKEVSRGQFKRVAIEAIPDDIEDQEADHKEKDMATQKPTEKQMSVDEIMLNLVEETNKLQEQLNKLVSKLENAALVVSVTREKENEELHELRKWKATLKTLMGS